VTDTQIAKREHPMVQLRGYLTARTSEIKTALPDHIEPERFIRVVMTAVNGNPDLLACERATLWNACIRCASDGLMPDGNEAALVPYKTRCTYIPMYQGLLKKFRNSGQFRHVNTGIVYAGEEFIHWIDETGEHFRHVPGDERNENNIRRVYATATTKDGAFFCADLTLSEVLKHEKMSRATREDAPWKMWRPEMMRKTAIRVLSKLLPKSSDLDAMMRRDEWDEIEDRTPGQERVADGPRALDIFGAVDPESRAGQPGAVPEGGGAVDADPAIASVESAAQTAAIQTDRPANSSSPTPQALELAYMEGKKDRARGVDSMVPQRYREDGSEQLARAWGAGWNGLKKP
jgi:recombination protein RecT